MTTVNTTDKALLVSFVNDCTAYQANSTRLESLMIEREELITKNGELRKAIVPVFKALSAHKWSAIKTGIKEAIEEAQIKDAVGLLGVLKTSFEYQIMPTQQNADRLRKAQKWTNWSGVVVPNTYSKVHAPKDPIQETIDSAKQSIAELQAIEATQTAQTAPAPAVQPKPAVKGTPESVTSVNVSAPDLSPNDLWVQACTQFLNFKLTAVAFETIEKKHGLEAGTLLKELVEARRIVTESTAKKGA